MFVRAFFYCDSKAVNAALLFRYIPQYSIHNHSANGPGLHILLHVKPKEDDMKKQNHKADIKNPNKGAPGQNKTHAKNQGNRGGQLNPNRKTANSKKS